MGLTAQLTAVYSEHYLMHICKCHTNSISLQWDAAQASFAASLSCMLQGKAIFTATEKRTLGTLYW